MSFAISSVALSAMGAVSGAIGSYSSAKSQKLGLENQAAMAEINARLSETSAQQELIKGQAESARLTMSAGQLKSKQRTSLAANGVILNEGSAAELQASTDILKEIDKNTIEANAIRSAWGYRTQGVNYQNEALTKRSTAGSISPFMSATSSLLGSAGQVAGQWYSLNKAGAF